MGSDKLLGTEVSEEARDSRDLHTLVQEGSARAHACPGCAKPDQGGKTLQKDQKVWPEMRLAKEEITEKKNTRTCQQKMMALEVKYCTKERKNVGYYTI